MPTNWWNWQKQQKIAINNSKLFLQGADIVPPNSFEFNNCTLSSQCASGYSCVKGKCVKVTNIPGNTGVSAGSSNDIGCGDGGSDLNSCYSSTSYGGCTTTGCGEKDRRASSEACCGQSRTCYYAANPAGGISVNCYCGDARKFEEEEGNEKCSVFCSDFYDSQGVIPSGCDSTRVCDECTTCDSSTKKCVQKSDAPCHCIPGKCKDCQVCTKSGICKKSDQNCKKESTAPEVASVSDDPDPEVEIKEEYKCPTNCPTDEEIFEDFRTDIYYETENVKHKLLCCYCDFDCNDGEACINGGCASV